MSITVNILKVPSSDGIHTLCGKVYLPEGEARGFFQIVHGMAEHIERYDEFMQKMASEGWICFGHDHLGHKMSVMNDSELGFIASKHGDRLLVRDVKLFFDGVKKEYGNRVSSPTHILMGHSMGSFVVRLAAERELCPVKLIIMGTGGKNPLASIGLALISLIKLLRGEKHISRFIDNMAFGSYNKRFDNGTGKDPYLWLASDNSAVRLYSDDKYCGFKFTVSAMGDLIRMIKLCNRSAWYKNLSKDIQVLLVSGSDDPVGNYAKGVREVEQKLKSQSIPTECIIYEGVRHEILNDVSREEVTSDIIKFCQK